MKRKKTTAGRFLTVMLICAMLISVLTACDFSHSETTDKTALQDAITNAETIIAADDYEDYTQETRAILESALTAAKTTYNNSNALQSEIDTSTSSLLDAITQLNKVDENGDESNFDEYAGLLMIWQVGAAKDGAITRNFIELYNNSDDDIDLAGYSIQYSKATGSDWTKIGLEGTIKARTSFLILGNEGTYDELTLANGRLFFEADEGDFQAEFALDNDGFKLCLVHGTKLIEVINPFDIDDEGTVVQGYVDFVGANNSEMPDAAEGSPVAKMSKQQSARRICLEDTDNNNADFTNIDYRADKGISDEEVEEFRPKNQAYGAWNPETHEL